MDDGDDKFLRKGRSKILRWNMQTLKHKKAEMLHISMN